MEQKQTISVIVPVYNVAAYLERCLASLAAQTYTNLEIILVDDASTDEGGRICDAWAGRDKRFQVVHIPVNRGLSAARNEGIRRARGAFAAFVDSDDYAEPDLLEKLYMCLLETGADISACGAEGLKVKDGPAQTYTRTEAVRCMARRTCFLWTAWGKLYPMELVKRHSFDKEALCCEDLLFFYQLLKETERVAYLPDRLYHYTCREGSLINSGVNERRCTVLSVLDRICEDASAGGFPEAVSGFQQIAMNTSVRLAMEVAEMGTAAGQPSEYLRRCRRSLRRHFSFEALALCPDRKDVGAELFLLAGTGIFQGTAAVYAWVKRLRTGRPGDGVKD